MLALALAWESFALASVQALQALQVVAAVQELLEEVLEVELQPCTSDYLARTHPNFGSDWICPLQCHTKERHDFPSCNH